MNLMKRIYPNLDYRCFWRNYILNCSPNELILPKSKCAFCKLRHLTMFFCVHRHLWVNESSPGIRHGLQFHHRTYPVFCNSRAETANSRAGGDGGSGLDSFPTYGSSLLFGKRCFPAACVPRTLRKPNYIWPCVIQNTERDRGHHLSYLRSNKTNYFVTFVSFGTILYLFFC